ncbi:MAG: hypothetical protein HUJ24_02980 [Rhodobacteraceae bacterium]|nr:hypothetical protein [Paracoccaceae bacterium]
MATLLLTHPDCLLHETPPGHPEQVARLSAVLNALDAPGFDALHRAAAPLAEHVPLLRVHPETVPYTNLNPAQTAQVYVPGDPAY